MCQCWVNLTIHDLYVHPYIRQGRRISQSDQQNHATFVECVFGEEPYLFFIEAGVVKRVLLMWWWPRTRTRVALMW